MGSQAQDSWDYQTGEPMNFDESYVVCWRVNPGSSAHYMQYFMTKKEALRFFTTKKTTRRYCSIVFFKWERSPFEGEFLTYIRSVKDKGSRGQQLAAFQYPNHEQAERIALECPQRRLFSLPGKITVFDLHQEPNFDGVYPLWRA